MGRNILLRIFCSFFHLLVVKLLSSWFSEKGLICGLLRVARLLASLLELFYWYAKTIGSSKLLVQILRAKFRKRLRLWATTSGSFARFDGLKSYSIDKLKLFFLDQVLGFNFASEIQKMASSVGYYYYDRLRRWLASLLELLSQGRSNSRLSKNDPLKKKI